MTGWDEAQMTPQECYDRLKLYESNGMLSYVLPTEPLGEQWVLGIDGYPLAKFAGTDIIPFIVGAETVIRHMAKERGLL